MAKEITRYDLIYIPTGEIVYHEILATKAAETLGVNVKQLRAKASQSKDKSATYDNYMVKQISEVTKVLASHRTIEELTNEFLRVCRQPKLWSTIDDTCLGDWYINDEGKAVQAHGAI